VLSCTHGASDGVTKAAVVRVAVDETVPSPLGGGTIGRGQLLQPVSDSSCQTLRSGI